MKNNSTLYSIALLALIIASSCKDKNAFIISGTLKNPGEIKKVYLLETDSAHINVVDSINLGENGAFKFKHQAPYANLYKLRIGSTIFDLIAQNGQEITFETDENDTTHAYTIAGSDDSEKIKEFNKLSNTYGEQLSKIAADYQAEAERLGKESDSLVKAYMPRLQATQNEINAGVIKFANENKTSLAGFYAITSLGDTFKYEQQLIAYADDIKDEFKDNPAVQLFIKQMMLVKPVSVGHKAPNFTINGIDGKPVSLADYKGKYVMLDFWASWCAPCRAENPNVVKQYAIYKNKGFNILGISLDENKADWQKAVANDKLTWRHGSDLNKFDGPTETLYHIEAIPSNFIIDPQGIIVAKNITGIDLEEFLKKTFSKAQ